MDHEVKMECKEQLTQSTADFMIDSSVKRLGSILIGLMALGAGGCATAGGAGGGERTRPADCVITDTDSDEVVIENCIVEMGPAGTPRSVRLPVYETHTRTPVGELTYPLTFEVDRGDGGGLVIRLKGTSLDRPDGEPPPETPEVGEEEQPEAGPPVPRPEEEESEEQQPDEQPE